MATRRFAKHGDANPGQQFEDLPDGPEWLDTSWHQYGNCDRDEDAAKALEQIQKVKGRPWAPWCDTCPVKGHCLQQGLQEDAEAPMKSGHRFQPYVYGGLAPSERRHLTERDLGKLRSRIGHERWQLRKDAGAA